MITQKRERSDGHKRTRKYRKTAKVTSILNPQQFPKPTVYSWRCWWHKRRSKSHFNLIARDFGASSEPSWLTVLLSLLVHICQHYFKGLIISCWKVWSISLPIILPFLPSKLDWHPVSHLAGSLLTCSCLSLHLAQTRDPTHRPPASPSAALCGPLSFTTA